MILRAALIPAMMLLAACDPQALADKTTRNIAHGVVMPVVSRDLPAGPAQQATECILDAASMPEIRALARDTGVEAGTQTRENVRNIALRPAAQSCFSTYNIPQVR
ncbi:hypothetical protein [Pseudogemmobacter bohemicus]|uniref:hypothetical protein n=1 Tax=Pseudogemmobacter bohemicus TaxID=2250708 RepID=UPI001E5CA4FB|nr:hypothetical protein [Pseudogemmobacter bohemicus]